VADDADDFPLLDGEAHVVQRLEQGALRGLFANQARTGVEQRLREALQGAEAVSLVSG